MATHALSIHLRAGRFPPCARKDKSECHCEESNDKAISEHDAND